MSEQKQCHIHDQQVQPPPLLLPNAFSDQKDANDKLRRINEIDNTMQNGFGTRY